ncbi:MAG: UbiD family decarboxylase [Candidatus Hadarchaeum sp.]|uniref:UbiD family decarboxylase n=1 Tax=Candidatus Hadarchaeum sp. TaxID=2883567 RepID=UPI003D1081D5
MDLRSFLKLLDEKGLLTRIRRPVDTKYEISTLIRLKNDRPLLFENVKGFSMPVVANLCSTRELVALGLGIRPEEIISKLAWAIDNPREPRVVSADDYHEVTADLTQFPILWHYPFDGGPYLSSAVVIARDPELGLNASFHRMMVIGRDRVVVRILPRDFDAYLKRGNKEFAICIGNSIPVLVAAAVSVELGKSELSIANALGETNLIELNGHLVPEAEIVMIAEMTGEEHDEGPFVDLTEIPDIVRKQPVARIKRMFVREGAVYHALLPGGLEHKTLMGMPREPTIFREVNSVCECKDVYITPAGCSWLHAVVSIKKKHPDDGKKAIEAAFRGHKSLKHVWVVDEDIDVHNPHEVEWAMATRFQGDRDIIMKREPGSSLDPSSDMKTRMTTKMGFDLTIPWGEGQKGFFKPEPPLKLKFEDYLE